ncbi:MAG: tetratricopeptide repeat protein [Spirochaetaceae bacterium]|nr:tetratricopeptide repeat protein [Spirochaetaceae bacterium]
MQILPVLVIAFISISAVIALSIGLRSSSEKKKSTESKSVVKDRETIIKDANRRLASNPKDLVALEALADLYYQEGEYKKAMRTYQLILDQAGSSPEENDGRLNLRYGLSAMKCEAWSEAYKGLVIARSRNPEGIEVNVNLGKLEFMRKNYEKTVGFFKRVLRIQPDHADSLKFLGQSLYRLNRFSEAVPYLKQAVVARPEDKESLYALARCQYEIPQLDMAQKIFRHLRTDPKWGPNAALYSGTIFAKKREWDEAITDYQIGLRHENVTGELQLELKYRLAEAFNQNQRIDRALALLNEIYETTPEYKDVAVQIKRYRELNSNKNLQIYLLAPTNEFIALCRKLTQMMFPRAKIKVNDMNVQKTEYVDLITEVKTHKWEDIVLFRFMRTEGQVGELFVRDLYAHSKELHAGRGFCFTAGNFTGEAVRFVEARLIDLIDKPALMKILKSIDSGSLTGLP